MSIFSSQKLDPKISTLLNYCLTMRRSQRRLQQLKQTIQMKLCVLEKQKNGIKEIVDDYTSDVVVEINSLLSEGQELILHPGQYHEIIHQLDKSSQVLSHVATTLDSILYAEESAILGCAGDLEKNSIGNELKNECVTTEKQDICSLSLAKHLDCPLGKRSVQDKDQLWEMEQAEVHHFTVVHPDANVEDEDNTNNNWYKNQDQLEKQNKKHEKQKNWHQEKLPNVIVKDFDSSNPQRRLVCQALLSPKTIDLNSAQFVVESLKTERTSSFPSSVASSASPTLLSSASSFAHVATADITMTHHFASADVSFVTNQLLDSSCKAPINTWISDPHVDLQPDLENLLQRSYQPLSVSLMSDHCDRILPKVYDASPVSGIASAVPFDILLTGFIGNYADRHSPYKLMVTNKPDLHQQKLSCFWTTSHENINDLLNINVPLCSLSQSSIQNNDLIVLNKISQLQQSNYIVPFYNPTFEIAFSECKYLSAASSFTSSQPLESESTASDLSSSSSTVWQNMASEISSVSLSELGADQEETVYSISDQSSVHHINETLSTSIVTLNCNSIVVLENISHESFTEHCLDEPIQNNKHSSLEVASLAFSFPKCLRQPLPMKRKGKKSSGYNRDLQQLMKDVEEYNNERSTKCNIDSTLTKFNVTALDTEESPLDIRPDKDSVFPAIISSLTHPWSFHVQTIDFIQVLTGLIKHAMETGAARNVTPRKDLYCLTKFCEETYQRAKILSLEEQKEQNITVKVLFIDYGIRKMVSPADIYSIPNSLIQYPIQAMFCALQRTSPLNEHCLWTEEAILEFQQQTKDAQVQVKIVHQSPSNNEAHYLFPNIVDIIFSMPQAAENLQKDTNSVTSMAEHLIAKGFARFMKEEDQVAALKEMYSLSKHKRMDKVKNMDVFIFNSKVPTFDESPAKLTTPKAADLIQCFQNVTDEDLSISSRQVAPENHVSSPSHTNSTSNLEAAMATTQKIADKEYSILVDEKLHHIGNVIRPSQVEFKNKETFKVLGQVTKKKTSPEKQFMSLLSNNCSLPLSSGDDAEVEIVVMVSSVISPSSFFVHCVNKDLVHKLNKLVQELQSLSTSALSKLSTSFNPSVYSLVCTQCSEDGCFYRGLVLEIEQDEREYRDSTENSERGEKKLLVFFIDHGDFDWIPRSKVFPLPNKFKNLSPLVLWCSLKCVKPHDTITVGDQEAVGSLVWSANAVKEFKSMVCGGKMLSAVISQSSLKQINSLTIFQFEPIHVLLMDKNIKGEEMCINYEFISTKLASLSCSEADQHTISSNSGEEWDPMNEEYTSLRNSYKVDTDAAGVALVGYTDDNTWQGQKACVYYNRARGCFRGDQCPNLHLKDPFKDVCCEKVPVRVFDEDQTDFLPQPGSAVAVRLSVICSPSLFYVNLPCGHFNMKQLHEPSQVLDKHLQEETLETMMNKMQEFYSSSKHYDGDLMLLARGQAMAAYIGHWVRAKVINTDAENGLVQVMSVDFGSVFWVDERGLRELELQFLHLTPQAIECSLADIEPQEQDRDWTEETCEKFDEMIKGRTIVAWIKQRYPSGRISVILYDTKDVTNASLNQELVDCGLAQLTINSRTANIKSTEETQRRDCFLVTNCMPS